VVYLAVTAPWGVELNEPGIFALHDEIIEGGGGEDNDILFVAATGTTRASRVVLRLASTRGGGTITLTIKLADGCSLGLLESELNNILTSSSTIVIDGGVLVETKELDGGETLNVVWRTN
jgi:hypothetical protein